MDAQALKKFYIVNDDKTALFEWKAADYASKTAFDTLSSKVDTLTAGGLSKQVVATLPTAENAEPNVIYLVPEEGSLSGTYVEYLCFVNTEGQKVLEKIGTTATDLTDYLTTAAAASTYLTQTDAANTYLTQANATSTYLTQTDASNTYLKQADATSTYATKDNLTSEVNTLNSSINDINTDLANKMNSYSVTQAAFDSANTSNSLENKSFYLITDAV